MAKRISVRFCKTEVVYAVRRNFVSAYAVRRSFVSAYPVRRNFASAYAVRRNLVRAYAVRRKRPSMLTIITQVVETNT